MGISVNEISGIIRGNEDLLKRNPELTGLLPEKAKRKYRNEPTIFEGVTFDSGREAARAAELTLQLKTGDIICLAYHVRFLVSPEGSKPIYYEADFVYIDRNLYVHIEDAKGVRTKEYRIKKKLFEAKYRLKIEEV